ncbi:uncharacterized protein LOC105248516 [Camponotus floridanus]|uniref:uncharacterized protein LOC105248516 n=1 Tax=Camponotus floridanus TaxID=104421 RepID=UPI000DC69B44|nr:uncharacterized protein LOC105248516 [Camponotus floridanus]XP_025266799.1 uncharacterized protein LOC105248516 [Camponotus floridanus]XP_025266800.1 uncharacterized protein LOC105248516 [Camponotus floridanus]XP_025266806.1 uncharacterized protein LOC105248516 [Camponotus floridanus]
MQKMIHEKQESRKVVKGNVTARPTIVSQLIIRPSTSNDGTNVLNIIQNIENNSMKLEHSFCCEKCRKNYLDKFVTIERKLNRIIHFLENENNVQRNEIEQDDVSLLPNFPLTTVEQTEMFNNRLEDINVRRQFMKKMAQFGGDTVAKLVKNIMLETIGYEVAAAYTWTGQKKRLSFKTSKLADTIIAIILKKKDTTTIIEVEGCIQEWLRRSGDRKRGLNK